jgi:hypothetical protein
MKIRPSHEALGTSQDQHKNAPISSSAFKPADPSLWNSSQGRRQFLKTTGKASAVTAIASTGMMFEVAYAQSVILKPDYIEYTLSSCAAGTWTGTGATRDIALDAATTKMQTARPHPAFQKVVQLAQNLNTWVGAFDPAPPTGDPFTVSVTGPVNGVYTATLTLTTAQSSSYTFNCYDP